MAQDLYRQLQQRLDKYSLGFPRTDSGVEIAILKELFSEADAAMFLVLSPILETAEVVGRRLNRPVDEIMTQLEDMAARGLLFRKRKGEVIKYGAIPFIHGLFEFQIKRLGPKLAGLIEEYHHEGLNRAVVKSADLFLRTVPIHQSLDIKHHVAAYDDACEIIRRMNPIVVCDCICRKQKGLLNETCGKPLEVCFMFGSMAQYYLDHDMGRQVEADEAINILKSAQAAGLVTQPATAQNPSGMCSCCGDCCGILRAINQHPKPAEIVFSNHFAVVDQGLCSSCETCLERCQMGAISMNAQAIAEIDLDRCIGCGLCITTCPTEALKLEPQPSDKHRTPPATGLEQMLAMAQKRGITF